jgi:hypothetical protein
MTGTPCVVQRWRELRGPRLFWPLYQDGPPKGLVTRPVNALGAGKNGVKHRHFVVSEDQVATSFTEVDQQEQSRLPSFGREHERYNERP